MDADPQGSMAASLGFVEQDDIDRTLATVMAAVMNDEQCDPFKGILHHARPKGKDIPADTMDRELTVFKNRLTGVTNRTGIKLFFQQESKRIAESTFTFDWELGWEQHYEQMEFTSVPDGVDLPFD